MVINLLLECVIVTVNDVVSPSELHGIAMSKKLVHVLRSESKAPNAQELKF